MSICLTTSPDGLRFIMEREGVVLQKYRDQAGYWTIGVGHLIRDWEEWPEEGITLDQAMLLLQDDVRVAEDAVNLYRTVPLEQHQFDALGSFVFNVGAGAFRRSTLLRLLNGRNYGSVPEQLARWNRAGGRYSRGLAKRRRMEGVLWTTGDYQLSARGPRILRV